MFTEKAKPEKIVSLSESQKTVGFASANAP